MKKIYITPETKFCFYAPLLMQNLSGGGTQPGDPVIGPNPDDSDDDNRSKNRNDNPWGKLW